MSNRPATKIPVDSAVTAQDPEAIRAAKYQALLRRVRVDWPQGTRVTYKDDDGEQVTGAVTGGSLGIVIEPGHENEGRVFIGVQLDLRGQVVRPFMDALSRI